MADWQAIRNEYEQGASLRSLATKYGVSKTYIIEKRDKEQWNRPLVTDRPTTHRPDNPTPPKPIVLPMPVDAHSIARIGLHQLAQHLQSEDGTLLSISSHKSLSDALAQYIKVLSTPPENEITQDNGLLIPFDRISARTRMEIRRLLAEDELHKSNQTEVS